MKCRLFKAVQETLPKLETKKETARVEKNIIVKFDSAKEVGRAVQHMISPISRTGSESPNLSPIEEGEEDQPEIEHVFTLSYRN